MLENPIDHVKYFLCLNPSVFSSLTILFLFLEYVSGLGGHMSLFLLECFWVHARVCVCEGQRERKRERETFIVMGYIARCKKECVLFCMG